MLHLTLLKDALHHASPEEAGRGRGTRRKHDDGAMNVAYGRGVLVGLVAGLMVAGKGLDEAWRLCLAQNKDILPDCVPPSWPSLSDYMEADKLASTSGGK